MKAIKSYISSVGAYGLLVRDIFNDILRRGVELPEFSKQLVSVGAKSVPIVVLTALFSGLVLALQTAYGLQRFGAKAYVGNIVSLALVRELGPVLTALMLCGRVGAGIAAEIGSMVATEQVDAIRALGADPVRKLVSPKVLACFVAGPLLVVFADLIGIYGGLVIAVYELNLSAHSYYRAILYTILIRDVLDGLIKAAIFGFLFSSIACFKGLHTRGGTEGVGQSTTEAVVVGSIVIFVSDFFITKFLILMG